MLKLEELKPILEELTKDTEADKAVEIIQKITELDKYDEGANEEEILKKNNEEWAMKFKETFFNGNKDEVKEEIEDINIEDEAEEKDEPTDFKDLFTEE